MSFITRYIPNPRLVGYIILLIPSSFVLLFAFGEILSGEASGYLHLVQLFPMLFLGLVVRRFPRFAGICFILAAIVLGIFYYFAMGDLSFWTKVLVELILFIPPLIAGFLFLAI